MDRGNLKNYINRLCFGMKFKNAEKETEFKRKLEETFIRYEYLLDQLHEQKDKFKTNEYYQGRFKNFMDKRAIHNSDAKVMQVWQQLSSMIYQTSEKEISINVEFGASSNSQIQILLNNMRREYKKDLMAEKKQDDKREDFMGRLDARDSVDENKAREAADENVIDPNQRDAEQERFE